MSAGKEQGQGVVAFGTRPPHPVPAPFRRPFPIPPQLSLENTMKIDYDSL